MGNGVFVPTKFKKSKIPKSKIKCQCDLYIQTNHCCMQSCLKNAEIHSRLKKIWCFTDEHFEILRSVLTDIGLQDVIKTIEDYLRGFNSHLGEFNIFSHGFSIRLNKPCSAWLNVHSNKHFHVQICGKANVGKSSLALRCAKNQYSDGAVEDNAICLRKTLKVCGNYGSTHRVTLSFFETGMFDFSAGRNEQIIYVFCVDPSSSDCFSQIQQVENEKYKILSKSDGISTEHDQCKCAFIVVATKCDLKNRAYIERSEGVIRSCKLGNVPYVEVSAKHGINIDLFMKTCVYELWTQSQTGCSC